MPARLRLPLVIAAALALVGGLAWAGWAWRHPHALPEGTGFSEFLSAAKVGRTSYFYAIDLETSPRVTFRSATPDVEVNTARATFQVLLCTPRHLHGADGIGVVSGRAGEQFCDFEPIAGAVVDPRVTGLHQLIVAITPHHAGRVEVAGLDLRYDVGWQTGTQHVRIRAGLRATH